MRSVRKCLSIFLVCAMLLCSAPLAGFVGFELPVIDFKLSARATEVVQSGRCGENVTFVLDSDGTLTISGIGAMYDYDKYYYVPWYSNSASVKEVVIKDGVTSIGKPAFSGCKSLTSVTIPDSVTSIEKAAFSNCSSLTSITIPDSVTNIGVNAFYHCDSLISVTFSANSKLTSIGYGAFDSCSVLCEITIANPDCNINDSRYTIYGAVIRGHDNSTAQSYAEKFGCTFVSLDGKDTDVILSGYCGENADFTITRDGTMHITGSGTMYDYGDSDRPWYAYRRFIKAVALADTITSIGDYAFAYCYSLTSVTIPDSVTSIGGYAFDNCRSLTSVTIPDSVTSIGSYSFCGCKSLTSVTIPDSVASIGHRAFYNCTSLTSVYITDLAAWCNIDFNDCNSNPLYYVHNLYLNGTLVTELTIPDTVTTIKNCAFVCSTSLTSVTIPDSVTSIGYEAFSGCDSLTSVTIPDSVTSIGYRAFNNCTSLTSVTIPDSVKSIEWYVFKGCTSLTSVTIPDSVTSIGGYAFSHCTSLTSVAIPDSVTSIEDGAFEDCTSLTSVHISDIAAWCNIDFGDNTANPLCCAHNLYLNGTLVTTLTIPDSVKSIGRSAFYNCTSLTSVTIPDSVTSIGKYAFEDCTSLTSVHIFDIAAWCNIYFVNYSNPLYYAHNLYLNGTLVTTLTIPDSVMSIGNYAFYYCTSLTSVTIPDSVTSIGHYAFYKCTSLTSVTIPDSVTSIGESAFYNCDSLTSVTILNPDCKIYDSKYTIYSGAIIYGFANSTAQMYAEKYNRSFEIFVCSHENAEIIPAVAPTCTTTGLTEGKKCSVCGEILEEQAEVSALGHTWDAGVVTTAPTVDAEGVKTFTCLVCGETKTEPVDKLVPSFTDGETIILKNENIVSVAGATTEQLLSQAGDGAAATDKNGNALAADAKIGTGAVLTLADGTQHVVVVQGDADGDGAITSSDARSLLRYSVGLDAADAAQTMAADVDSDGRVSSSDARLALRASVGLEKPADWLTKIK